VGEKGLPFFKVGKEMQMEIDSFLKATGMSFLYGCKISMRNDHLYRDPEYPWDEYIQA
jgi:hypothetical protein